MAILNDGLNDNVTARCYGGLTYPVDLDVNFGVTAGICEMFLQSHDGAIEFLPALPKAWPEGSVRGLRARCGFEVDLTWRDGRIVEAAIRSTAGQPCRLRCSVPVRVTSGGRAVQTHAEPMATTSFDTQTGQTYRIIPSVN